MTITETAAKKQTIQNLKQTITKMENKHLRVYTSDLKIITTVCRVCGDANGIYEKADAPARKANHAWFAHRHKACAEKFTERENKDALAKVVEIFASRHVSTVEVGFEYEAGNVRYYSAITNDRGIPHRYRVRIEDSFETGERVTVARCNCPAKSTCRHIAAVAKEDAARINREIYPNEIAKYRAHKQAA